MPSTRFTVPANLGVPPDELRTVVELLGAFPGVRRVWLFGRRVKQPESSDFRSDLDIAVEGLASGDHARAWAAPDAESAVAIDLVRWEEASALLQEEVSRHGILVYESVA